MAGSYPDVPDHRMPYDMDGTVVVGYDMSNIVATELSQSQKRGLNDESSSSFNWTNGGGTMAAILNFPELRDIFGYRIQYGNLASLGAIETSVDTVTGLEGTWTQRAANWVGRNGFDLADIRSNIQPLVVAGVKAIRFRFSQPSGTDPRLFYTMHIYGRKSAPNHLAFWHPTLDQELDGAYFDIGDRPLDEVPYERDFRIKNTATAETANGVVVTREALTYFGPPSSEGLVSFSDGGAFVPSLNIGDLAPGAMSVPVTMHRASGGVYGLAFPRATAEATTWS